MAKGEPGRRLNDVKCVMFKRVMTDGKMKGSLLVSDSVDV